MKQVILIEDRMEVYNLLESNLLCAFEDLEIISKLNSSDALKTLELLPSISLVVCRDCIDDDATAKNIISFLEKYLFNTKVIVLGKLSSPGPSRQFVSISDPQEYLDVITHASRMLNIPIQRNKPADSKYAQIPISYFSELETTICDVYTSQNNSVQTNQYTKIISAGETFNQERISNIEDTFLFIPSQERHQFANILSDLLMKKIDKINYNRPPLNKKLESLASIHQFIAWETHFQGFVPAAVQLAEKLVDSTMEESAPNNHPIPTILRQVANTKSNYLYKHGYMVFAVSNRVLNEIGVNDKKSYRSLCFASLFKDISLVNNPQLSQITTFEKLESMEFNPNEYNAIMNHACESAFALKDALPKKSIELIVRHHGHPNGNGFSNTHFKKFDILDRTFFINCEFVKEFLTFEQTQRSTNQRTTPITYRLRRRYFFPEVSDAIDILNKTLQKNKPPSPKT